MTIASPTSLPQHLTSSNHDTSDTPGSVDSRPTHSEEQDYLSAVKRMHARQDAWSRAARSASASVSASASDSRSISRSQSPTKYGEGLYMSSSVGEPSGSAPGSGVKTAGQQAQKKGRKKVAKACLACQKSHVTCDDKRPCTRCVKKGTAEQCVEGVRKKAKYLLEEDEKIAMEASQPSYQPTARSQHHPSLSPVQNNPHISPTFSQHTFAPNVTPPSHSHRQSQSQSQSQPQTQLQAQPQSQSQAHSHSHSHPTSNLPPSLQPNSAQRSSGLPDDIWLAPPLEGDTGIGLSGVGDGRMWFGSGALSMADNTGGTSTPFNTNGMTAATSEYAMLDSMFAMDPVFPGLGGLDGLDQPMQVDQQFVNPAWTGSPQRQSDQNNTFTSLSNAPHPSQQQQQQQQLNADRPGMTSSGLDANAVLTTPPSFDLPTSPWTTWLQNQMGGGGADGTTGAAATAAGLLAGGTGKKTMSSSEVYKTVTKPYDYTEGYHTLMEYLTNNFERKDILRVVHSLASYRPSLIALQMPMSEEDEVFLEKSFQRTLIELEKLISYSATPTAVWRRTGEVCYANPEFCTLVKRGENDLFGSKKNYIYRLFSRPSVIAYWENFSVHAFENTTQNFFQPTTLVLNAGSVDCSCCFTIRRDVFDLPSVVIGQFLPIPQDG